MCASYVQRLTSQLEGLQGKARQPTKPDKAQKVEALAMIACTISALPLALVTFRQGFLQSPFVVASYLRKEETVHQTLHEGMFFVLECSNSVLHHLSAP